MISKYTPGENHMRKIIENLEIIAEADAQLQALGQQLDALVDQLDEQDDDQPKPAKSKPRDRIEVFGRPRQR
jgi:hypothetical protein